MVHYKFRNLYCKVRLGFATIKFSNIDKFYKNSFNNQTSLIKNIFSRMFEKRISARMIIEFLNICINKISDRTFKPRVKPSKNECLFEYLDIYFGFLQSIYKFSSSLVVNSFLLHLLLHSCKNKRTIRKRDLFRN